MAQFLNYGLICKTFEILGIDKKGEVSIIHGFPSWSIFFWVPYCILTVKGKA